MKKAVSIFLAFIFVVGICASAPVTIKANAASVDDLTFELNEDGESYYVADCDMGASGELVIQDTYNGLPVTSIGDNAFYECTSLTSVTMPNSITRIGAYAFSECTSLTNITIPDSVTSIGLCAFLWCDSLTSVTIPDSVTRIDEYAFSACFSLVSVNISDIASWCNIDFYYEDSNPLSCGSKLYLNGELVTELRIPEGVTEIKGNAFNGCTSLTNVTIPDSVTSIGGSAFSGCTSLTSITIPDGVTSIGWDAFYGCTSLTSATIPDSVTSISDCTFGYCSSLESINVSSDNIYYSSIDGVLFNKEKTELLFYPSGRVNSAYMIPDGVTRIGAYAFGECSLLTSITISDSVTSIDDYLLFSGCSSLESINVSNENNAYSSSEGVLFNKERTELLRYPEGKKDNTYTIPEGVTNICMNAFYQCKLITGLTISDGVKEIGIRAFYDCISLENITLPDSVTDIAPNAFSGCSALKKTVLPYG
ncbi:MAG: leucine-rich repeat domain-containing protein, partial [Clostridia bacterium]|nr:leucine-rich repeat domain-containing protein [Clostridia bacterium]